MLKKNKKKIVKQNKRNQLLNYYYLTQIKRIKLFIKKYQHILIIFLTKKEASILINFFYSTFDKAVKKKIIHINTAAKKKSLVANLILNIK